MTEPKGFIWNTTKSLGDTWTERRTNTPAKKRKPKSRKPKPIKFKAPYAGKLGVI